MCFLLINCVTLESARVQDEIQSFERRHPGGGQIELLMVGRRPVARRRFC